MSRAIAFFLMTTIVLAGCASGFDRKALKQSLEVQELQITEDDIKRVLELKPQVKFPLKLGIYLGSERSPGYPYAPEWRWNDKNKNAVASWGERLKADGIVSDAFVVSDATTFGQDLKSIRLAAARHGTDAVLVIKGGSQVDRYLNPLAFLNITIVGGYLFPGSHRDALFMIMAALWDVRNEYLYLTVEAEGVAKTVGPTFVVNERHAVESAKEEALSDFRDEFFRRMKSLKGI